ncbi:MAG: peptidoglycan DD-metalloendopeptidase family protein [Rhodospirillaceae bacterium]|jgi:murein DD-endopeptidase MepM/ murein hydrolase activator NlpD|nr:peptidoglycan DD-metalloendopeptidase family protein [Rhodospirillales bacterium]MBT3904387.1 peptidoglycan DD-metalloendopeptidase family protein [Rhodospirillaceae bacterium]MBT4702339.1 peptidoglycan DD-metalloendopeptidase family protein [Rhodospirillaceae bacterium]MBT5036787.1 peptidoglycan DD-metalloendopeptidase family protein [Rhodospirillaceae bacterium]MBT6222294.1 peptidoglycan DD-metalloendopeptidase family protein [Rhodospirillaceae bacterium]
MYFFRKVSSIIVMSLLAVGLVAGDGSFSPANANPKKIKRIFKKNDSDGDNKISADEWPKSTEAFKKIDADGDGYLTKSEFKNFFAGGGGPGGSPRADRGEGPKLEGEIQRSDIDETSMVAFRARLSNPESQERGLLESTLEPIYPEGLKCPKIDHIYGEEWQGPVPDRIHTGSDIPAGWDDPIYAMADGQVVAKFLGEKGHRGLQLVLRHTPEETGLPVWVYTLYSHFFKLPTLKVGDRVRMGDYLGPNGASGVPSRHRDPHLHLTVYYSTSPEYAVSRNFIFPQKLHFTDAVALFRGGMPLHPAKLRKLPDDQKKVKIVYKTKSGEISKPGSKFIWPFACRKE